VVPGQRHDGRAFFFNRAAPRGRLRMMARLQEARSNWPFWRFGIFATLSGVRAGLFLFPFDAILGVPCAYLSVCRRADEDGRFEIAEASVRIVN